jgi:hypothetical protein
VNQRQRDSPLAEWETYFRDWVLPPSSAASWLPAASQARHFMVARLCQKFLRLSVPPNNVVKLVESTSTMSPARPASGGIQM